MNTCPNCGKMAGLHGSILQGCMCQYSMQAPPQRTWVNATTWRGLTDEERAVIVEANTTDDHGYDIWCNVIGVALAIEAKLKDKNT